MTPLQFIYYCMLVCVFKISDTMQLDVTFACELTEALRFLITFELII